MKNFNEEFRTNLYKTIEEIENNSLVEIVTIVKSRSENYKDISLWAGFIILVLTYSFFMFSPFEFDVYLIYFFTIASFFIGYFIFSLIDGLKILFTSKKRKKKSVEIMARAIFQKGGIRFTNDKIGVLIFCSVVEKEVFILADRGAETMIPEEEWEHINKRFSHIFLTGDPAKNLINELEECKSIFNKYIPPIENDINELPDDLNVYL